MTTRKKPTPEQMQTAATWLEHSAAMDANNEDAATLKSVAAWLNAQADSAAYKYIARRAGVTVNDVKRFIAAKATDAALTTEDAS